MAMLFKWKQEVTMKRLMLVLLVLLSASCIKQTINHDVTFVENHTFGDVWDASIKALYDIEFTVDSMDKEAGFISAERGRHILLQEAPPRLSIKIEEMGDKVKVDCRVLQKEQLIDIMGHGRKTIRDFMIALNLHLNR
jgi:hypothetical protein